MGLLRRWEEHAGRLRVRLRDICMGLVRKWIFLPWLGGRVVWWRLWVRFKYRGSRGIRRRRRMCMLRPSGRTVVVLGQDETHMLISEVEAQSEDVYVVIFF